MAKISGLGERFYLVQTGANGVGLDISGDVGSIDGCNTTLADMDDTGIDKSYHERLAGLVDADLSYTGFFNPTTSFPLAKGLVGLDGAAIWATSAAEGAACFAMQGLIDTFPINRSNAGALTIKPKLISDAGVFGWGFVGMNATDTTPSTHATMDDGVQSTAGATLFAILLGFTGTSVTLTVKDSADNVTFTAVTGLTVTFTGAGTGFAVASTADTATLREYVQIATTGTFSSAQVVAAVLRN